MKIKAFTFVAAGLMFMSSLFSITKAKAMYTAPQLINISQQLLLAAKTREPVDSLANIAKNIPTDDLSFLNNDDLKKAFWINMYNAYTQILLTKNAAQYKNRGAFFGSKQIQIAGYNLSLDDIEHGVLRHSKIKWSEGYLNKIFPSKFEKLNRVKKVDYRIHFSLNCGAKSCPPIAFYDPEKLSRQLDIATKTYLKGEAEYDSAKNIIALPAIMSWFRRDFAGKKKMKKLLKKIEIIPENSNPKIIFKKYDWNLFLENYKPKTNG